MPLELQKIFDWNFYSRQRPDLAAHKNDLLSHYLDHGWREKINPHPLFDESYYQRWNGAAGPGLVHYLTVGEEGGAWPSAAFDPQRYAYLAGLKSPSGALSHYVRRGAANGISPHLLIEAETIGRRADAPAWSTLGDMLEANKKTGRGLYDLAIPASFRWAVVAHIFYPELLNEVADAIERLPSGGDVFVTVAEGDAKLLAAVKVRLPWADVVECANTGRDIAPFIAVLPRLIGGGYQAVLKLHTKLGQTEPDTWRYAMIQPLVDAAGSVLASFARDDTLRMVGPRAFYLSGERFIGPNRPALQRLIGEHAVTPARWGFFAGTMFWCRPSALTPLLGMVMDFDGSNRSNDGLLEHAVERLLGLVATGGGRVGLIDLPNERSSDLDLTLRNVPGPLIEEELADTLPVETGRLWVPLRKLQVRRRRRWTPPKDSKPGVILIGPVGAQHGLGVSARGYLAALRNCGAQTSVYPWIQGFERVRTVSIPRDDNPVYDSQRRPISLVHLNLDLLTVGRLFDIAPLDELVSLDRYSVAIVSWELLHVPYEWQATLEKFDEIWVASTFTQRALAAVTRTPVRVVRPTVPARPDASTDRAALGLPGDRFMFCYVADMGSVPARKNPIAFLRAYLTAFAPEDGAACLLKLHYPEADSGPMQTLSQLAKGREDVVLMTRSLDNASMDRLFASIDCYVSPHRSEGVGLTIIEAMLAGKPVIATRYGGVQDFVNGDTALSPEHRLIQVGSDAEPYPATAVWADPLEDSIAACMKDVFTDLAGAARRGQAARAHAETLFGNVATAAALSQEIDRIWTNASILQHGLGV
jgi:glycosyltransferase involved in cell wall biosynthesis